MTPYPPDPDVPSVQGITRESRPGVTNTSTYMPARTHTRHAYATHRHMYRPDEGGPVSPSRPRLRSLFLLCSPRSSFWPDLVFRLSRMDVRRAEGYLDVSVSVSVGSVSVSIPAGDAACGAVSRSRIRSTADTLPASTHIHTYVYPHARAASRGSCRGRPLFMLPGGGELQVGDARGDK